MPPLAHVNLTECIYFRMQSVIWETSGLGYTDNIKGKAIEALREVYLNEAPEKPLVINMSGIDKWDQKFGYLFFGKKISKEKDPDTGAEVIKYLDSPSEIQNALNRAVIFIDFNPAIRETFLVMLNACKTIGEIFPADFASIADFVYSRSAQNTGWNLNFLKNIKQECEKKEEEYLKKIIRESFIPNTSDEMKLLPSSQLLSNGEFDASLIISNPKDFMFVSIKLACLVSTVIRGMLEENTPINKIRLLGVSLRGAPFVSAINNLISPGESIESEDQTVRYDIIDHLGPKQKLFDFEFLNRGESEISYCLVGDFIIGGTEIQIAKTYVEILGCKLKSAVAIGNYLPTSRFVKKNVNVQALCELKKVGIKNLKYKFEN